MVTGGASGMGLAMAIEFAKAGANVSIGSLLSSSKVEGTKGELVFKPGQEQMDKCSKVLEDLGVKVFTSDLDVASNDSVEYFFTKTKERLGPVDILANAAGITAEHGVCGHEFELWQRVMDVNLNGTFFTTRLCLPEMMERGFGRIINIASTAASVGAPTSAAYCASKAAVVGLTKCVALEGAARNVTCNTISPGWVDTQFGTHWMSSIANDIPNQSAKEYIEDTKAQNPQQRLIQPTEIGALAAFLCSEGAKGITMQDLTVSAGSLW
jgi:NAD(P)-dependent dehydrogenase (short-subunit alcohol dehydrogenase family)